MTGITNCNILKNITGSMLHYSMILHTTV